MRKDSVSDAILVQVGEKCQLFSRDTGEWVNGTVVASKADGQVCVQWEEPAPVTSLSPRPGSDSSRVASNGLDPTSPRSSVPTIAREHWVLQSSSEFRRASSNSSRSANYNRALEDSFESAHASEKQKSKMRLEQEAQQRVLTAQENKLALQALLAGSGARTLAQIRALAAWTWKADLFHGASLSSSLNLQMKLHVNAVCTRPWSTQVKQTAH